MKYLKFLTVRLGECRESIFVFFYWISIINLNLTSEQCIAILEAGLSSTKLVKMVLYLGIEIRSEIPAYLLKNNRVEILWKCGNTTISGLDFMENFQT